MKIDPIQSVADELEILRILATLAQSVDDRDEARYRACLADEVMLPGAGADHCPSGQRIRVNGGLG